MDHFSGFKFYVNYCSKKEIKNVSAIELKDILLIRRLKLIILYIIFKKFNYLVIAKLKLIYMHNSNLTTF